MCVGLYGKAIERDAQRLFLPNICCTRSKISKQALYFARLLVSLQRKRWQAIKQPSAGTTNPEKNMQRIISGEFDSRTARLMAHTIHEPIKSCEILYPDPFP
jgi:hypothetical protein